MLHLAVLALLLNLLSQVGALSMSPRTRPTAGSRGVTVGSTNAASTRTRSSGVIVTNGNPVNKRLSGMSATQPPAAAPFSLKRSRFSFAVLRVTSFFGRSRRKLSASCFGSPDTLLRRRRQTSYGIPDSTRPGPYRQRDNGKHRGARAPRARPRSAEADESRRDRLRGAQAKFA